MNFGEFRKLEWLKFDQNAVDVLVLADKPFLLGLMTNFTDDNNDEEMRIYDEVMHKYDDMDIDELFKIVNDLLQKRHLFWEVIEFGGAKYINLVFSEQDPYNGDWDDDTVLEFNISAFKVPTIIIAEN